MWKKLPSAFRSFRHAQPGERFLNAHDELKERGPAGFILPVFGGVLVVAGLILGLLPGVPGVVLIGLGLGLIATRFRGMARWLDWLELRGRKLVSSFRRRFLGGPKIAPPKKVKPGAR